MWRDEPTILILTHYYRIHAAARALSINCHVLAFMKTQTPSAALLLDCSNTNEVAATKDSNQNPRRGDLAVISQNDLGCYTRYRFPITDLYGAPYLGMRIAFPLTASETELDIIGACCSSQSNPATLTEFLDLA